MTRQQKWRTFYTVNMADYPLLGQLLRRLVVKAIKPVRLTTVAASKMQITTTTERQLTALRVVCTSFIQCNAFLKRSPSYVLHMKLGFIRFIAYLVQNAKDEKSNPLAFSIISMDTSVKVVSASAIHSHFILNSFSLQFCLILSQNNETSDQKKAIKSDIFSHPKICLCNLPGQTTETNHHLFKRTAQHYSLVIHCHEVKRRI